MGRVRRWRIRRTHLGTHRWEEEWEGRWGSQDRVEGQDQEGRVDKAGREAVSNLCMEARR